MFLLQDDSVYSNRAIIEKFGMYSYSMQEVDKYGIREVVDRALKQIDPK